MNCQPQWPEVEESTVRHMKHISFGDKNLLVGDEAADLLMEYATLLANLSKADSVELHAFGADGQEVTVSFLLDAGAILSTETTHTSMNEPDNHEAIEYLRSRIGVVRDPPSGLPDDETWSLPDEYEIGQS
jgi:hypothetical protein